MSVWIDESPARRSPLEEFLRDYCDAAAGVCEEVEPQVYDVLLPAGELSSIAPDGIVRVTFDPEALAEHPGAQLASLGTPLVDGLLAKAVEHGRYARAYLNGLNLAPFDLARQVQRALVLPERSRLWCERVRALDSQLAVYWFEVTFVSDEKEQDLLTIGVDLATGREVRHWQRLLESERLSDQPAQLLPEARRMSVAAGYPLARERALRTLSALANSRRRELAQRTERQIERMTQYYGDLTDELSEQQARSQKRGDDASKFPPRLAALAREESLRIGELRQKAGLAVQLRLVSLLVVHQPKLHVQAQLQLADERAAASELALVWDPFNESLEAAACPQCGAPSYEFAVDSRLRLCCPACQAKAGRGG